MTDAFDYKRKKLLVSHGPCDECLLSKAKIVGDARRDQILRDCERTGRYFICHKATMAERAVVCAAFVDRVPNQAVQVASRLGLVLRVDPSTGEP